MTKITHIEGIGEQFALQLRKAGITTTENLLKKGSSTKGRKEIAGQTGISQALILKWVHQADLLRIKGIAEEYAELLVTAGVKSTADLARRRPENLCRKMAELNANKNLVRQLPAQSQVASWIVQAQWELGPIGGWGGQEFKGQEKAPGSMPFPEEDDYGNLTVFAVDSLPGDGGIDNQP